MKTNDQKIMVLLLKDFRIHTATSLSRELSLSRQGTWKILKELEKDKLIILESIGNGKTSTKRVKLNWHNDLIEKILALALAQEAEKQKRWKFNFADLEKKVDFLILFGSILHSPKEANDIDIMGVVSRERKLIPLDDIILKIQLTQIKKIHSINLTQKEFIRELKMSNKAYLEALKKGVILFGWESFIKLIKGLQT